MTGRLEVNVQRGTGPQFLIHSKRGGQGYVHDDWTGFDNRLSAALKKLEAWKLTTRDKEFGKSLSKHLMCPLRMIGSQ